MANAVRDNNGNTVSLGVDNTGEIVRMIEAEPTTHGLEVDDMTGGAPTDDPIAEHDANGVTTMMAVSELDGTTPVTLVVTALGNLKVDST